MVKSAFDLWVPPEVERVIHGLRGKKLGLGKTLRQLEIDPCALDAYRLRGVLQPRVCGYHLRDPWRLAFSFLDEDPEGKKGTVVVLYVGEKEPDEPRSLGPIWQLVHDIFGEEYGSGSKDRQPCCEDEKGRPQRPQVDEDEVLDAMERLRAIEKQARRKPRARR